MQLSSMTGFSRVQTNFAYQNKRYHWTWEFKSVNGKSMDVKTRLPQWLDDLDETVKSVCAKTFSRGSFNIVLNIEVEDVKPSVQINTDLLNALVEKATEIYQNQPQLFSQASPAELLKISGVVKMAENTPDETELEILKNELCQTMLATATALKQDRLKEGQKIGEALQHLLSKVRTIVAKVQEITKDMPLKLKEKILRQINELADDATVSEERLAQEALFLILKADVKEEIDRLTAHIKTAEELLQSKEPIGRRLDFLCQELNREANTLCSKSADIEQTKYGMELKALIEQFREQVQNME